MILVTGATGNVGREVVRQLQGSGQPIRVFSRNPQAVVWSADVQVMNGDLTDPEAVKAALDGVKKVFLVRVPGGEQFAEIAKQLGVEHIVFLSSSAIDARSENAIGRAHAQAEELIQKSSVPYTFLRPGAFMSNVLQWAHSIKMEKVVRAPLGDLGTNPIDPRDIAAMAAQALLSPGHEGKVYTLTGPEILTVRDQVQTLGELLGEDIWFEEIPANIAQEYMKRFAPEEIVDALFQLMEETRSHPVTVSRTVEEVTGQPAHTFRDWADYNIDKFR